MLNDALNSERPYGALRTLVETAASKGYGRDTLLEALESLRPELVANGRADQEDVVLEVMDCVVGWCAPAQKVAPSAS